MEEVVYFKITDVANVLATPILLRCPHCNREAALQPVTGVPDANGTLGSNEVAFGGIRRCPNPECFGLVLVIRDGQNTVRATFPSELIDFDPSGIPSVVQENFKEAVLCHGNSCYRAAAIMVRRTLEVLCQDKEATGDTLKERLEGLRQKLAVPKELFDAANELRLLGNDAAHIEAQTYIQVGREEVEAALDLAKELMKATYQYASLLDRLRGLQQPSE